MVSNSVAANFARAVAAQRPLSNKSRSPFESATDLLGARAFATCVIAESDFLLIPPAARQRCRFRFQIRVATNSSG